MSKTYQSYYVDVPRLTIERYFVRSATSAADAKRRASKLMDCQLGECEVIDVGHSPQKQWHSRPGDRKPKLALYRTVRATDK
jgi:hypothetical protein